MLVIGNTMATFNGLAWKNLIMFNSSLLKISSFAKDILAIISTSSDSDTILIVIEKLDGSI